MHWQIRDMLSCFHSDSVLWLSEDVLQFVEISLASREGWNKILFQRCCGFMLTIGHGKPFAAAIPSCIIQLCPNYIALTTHMCTIFHYVLLLGRGTRAEESSAGLNDRKTSASGALHKPCGTEGNSAGCPRWTPGLCRVSCSVALTPHWFNSFSWL